MLRKLLLICLSAVLALGGTACKKKETAAERQAKKEKEFRDGQKAKAQKAYQDLVTKYPDSEFAAKAKERLAVIGTPAPATPAPKKK